MYMYMYICPENTSLPHPHLCAAMLVSGFLPPSPCIMMIIIIIIDNLGVFIAIDQCKHNNTVNREYFMSKIFHAINFRVK